MIKHKRKERSDKLITTFEQVACRVTWTEKGPRNAGALYKTPCSICGKPGKVRTIAEFNRDLRNNVKSYCSIDCSRQNTKSCKICNKRFSPGIKKGIRGKYCSKNCYSSWQRSNENTGPNNPCWKVEATHEPENQKIRKSLEWKEWRNKVYIRDQFLCKFCKSNKQLEPHHIKPRRLRPDLIFDVNNGITLCKKCHALTIGKEEKFEETCISLIEAGYFHK